MFEGDSLSAVKYPFNFYVQRLVHLVLARKAENVKEIHNAEQNSLNLDFRNMSDHGAPILYCATANRDAEIDRPLIMAGCHIFTLRRDCDNREIPVMFSALAPDMSPMPDNLSGQRELHRRLLYKGSTILEVTLGKQIPQSDFEIILQRGGPPLLASRVLSSTLEQEMGIQRACSLLFCDDSTK
ncbi:uncharacterized protein LOC120848588 [Ixodes scapularis]|uniref:uncharacterized protein LOC120848588 n=1 Tax=Ixodes scapularis TaxID=6945 RepID=UPI001A9F56D0|nr:uncharacterized protein LOC120848588 [Ixodes scapularis]